MDKIDIYDSLDPKDAKLYSPLALAYVGDSVFELMVRAMFVLEKDYPVSLMHKRATKFVSARAQSAIIENISEFLTEQETEIYKRGRNAKVHTMAKNMSVEEYKKSTGFEALVGYLFITGQLARLKEIFSLTVDVVEKSKP